MSQEGENWLGAVELEEGADSAEGYGSGGSAGGSGTIGLRGEWQGTGYRGAKRRDVVS
jgi:hypothetical protein